jgi:hypothetical protein
MTAFQSKAKRTAAATPTSIVAAGRTAPARICGSFPNQDSHWSTPKRSASRSAPSSSHTSLPTSSPPIWNFTTAGATIRFGSRAQADCAFLAWPGASRDLQGQPWEARRIVVLHLSRRTLRNPTRRLGGARTVRALRSLTAGSDVDDRARKRSVAGGGASKRRPAFGAGRQESPRVID